MGCFGPDSPDNRNYGQETKDTLKAQLDLMPQWVASERQYRPQLAALDVGIAEQTLPRLMSMYGQIAPELARIEASNKRAQVGGDVETLGQYAGDVSRTLRQASGNATLLDLLTREAEAGLQADGLDPATAAAAAQSVRSAQAGRGMMTAGMPAVSQEALFGADRARMLRDRARSFASGVVGLNQGAGGDASMVLLGRPSQTLGWAPGAVAGASAYIPGSVFNPESPYAGNLYASNAAYDWQYKQADPSTMARIGQVSNTFGEFVGSVGKGFIGCWVAREVYGQGDEWMEFRAWLLSLAPQWFRALYIRFGPRLAAWLSDKPRLKRIVRRWMDGRRMTYRLQRCSAQ